MRSTEPPTPREILIPTVGGVHMYGYFLELHNVSRLMPSSINSKTPVNVEKGRLYLQWKCLFKKKTQARNMKKNQHSATLFLCNLALFNAPQSMNWPLLKFKHSGVTSLDTMN